MIFTSPDPQGFLADFSLYRKLHYFVPAVSQVFPLKRCFPKAGLGAASRCFYTLRLLLHSKKACSLTLKFFPTRINGKSARSIICRAVGREHFNTFAMSFVVRNTISSFIITIPFYRQNNTPEIIHRYLSGSVPARFY